MIIHELKTWQEYYVYIERQLKNFEVRKNDRNFSVGDVLHLRETDSFSGKYTGNECLREIIYILDTKGKFGIEDGTVVLGLKFLSNYSEE